jgi:hypothetical protein
MNDKEDQQQVAPDYLDQIAPKSSKKRMDFLRQKPLLTGFIILAAAIIITIVAMIVSNLSGGTKPIQTLSARLTSTSSTVKLANKTIKSSNLSDLNSSLNIILTNTTRDLQPILVLNKIVVSKIDKSITAAESNTKMLATLEEARLNVRYERIYVIEMNTQLEKLLLLMNQIRSSTSSNKTKLFLDNAIKNIEPIQKQFENFNAPNS